MHFLSAEQVEALADAIEHPPVKRAGHGARPTGRDHFPEYAALIRFAAYSGLRAGEIAGLRVRRLDLLKGKVEVAETLTDVDGTLVSSGTTKTSKVRTVPIPRFIAEQLAPLLAGKSPDDYVFTSPEGGPLRHSNFYRRHYLPAVDRAGLTVGVRFHDLRHIRTPASSSPRAPTPRRSWRGWATPRSRSPSIATATCCRVWRNTSPKP